MRQTRFSKSLAVALVAALLSGALSLSGARAQGGKTVPPFPSKPVTLQIIDVAGEKQLVQGMIDNYVKANPDKVEKVEYISDTAPNLPGRIKAQEDAGKIDTAIVLSGYDGVSSGIAQNLW